MLVITRHVRQWSPLLLGVAFGLATTWTTVAAASLLPHLLLTSLTNGEIVSGAVPLSAVADATGLAGVRFQVSGLDVGPEITAGSCSTYWDSRTVPDGVRTIVAVGRDSIGNTVTSAPVLITVLNNSGDTTPPSVTVTSPTSGATVLSVGSLTATATDNVGVAGVWFSVDGAPIGPEDTVAPYTAAWSTLGVPTGAHVITATARDAAGNTQTSAALVVTVTRAASRVAGDFNGDGYPDLLFEHASGQLHAWFMSGGLLIGSGALNPGAVKPEWQVVAVDDFNGDGRSDLLWQHRISGQLYIWLLDGVTLIGHIQPLSAAADWRVAGTGDLNGDGRADIVWKNRVTGQLYVWMMNGGSMSYGSYLNPQQVALSWRLAGTADINHDGQTDLVWQNSSTGALVAWYMNGTTAIQTVSLAPAAVPAGWEIRSVADYDRDGNADLIWQNMTTGELFICYMSGPTIVRQGYLTPGQVALGWQVVGSR